MRQVAPPGASGPSILRCGYAEGQRSDPRDPAMDIKNQDEHDDAEKRANAISDAPEGAPEVREFAGLVGAIRAWDEAQKGENANGVEDASGLTRPDNLSVSGLPGSLGKL
jgi:hypothetical protein